MKAIISDIHGNLEALQAVLDDIGRHPVKAICCLGDLFVYGPNPRECVHLAMRWNVVIKGNFDHAILDNPLDLTRYGSEAAARSLAWSWNELDAHVPDQQAANRRWTFLNQLMTKHQEDDFLFVHGSARNPLHEYVFPEDIYNQRKMEHIFALVDQYCFQGHTHVPGIFIEQADDLYSFSSPEEIEYVHRLDNRKTLCNVGSVGQPRDGDWCACYVLLDGNTVRFRRIEYDIETTIRKIRGPDDLDDFLGDRLRGGR